MGLLNFNEQKREHARLYS